jgi:hypothetical protein
MHIWSVKMSGSSGGGYGGGFNETASECSDLVINTQVSSPKPSVVKLLNVGDILAVSLVLTNATEVVQLLSGSELLGGVASPDVNKLKNCLRQGVQFEATVKEIRQGQVTIRIAAATA